MRYFFMAEPIRAMEGDLLGVEITTHFASSPARPLHPDLLSRHGTIRRSAVFCLICCGQSRLNMAGFYATACSVS